MILLAGLGLVAPNCFALIFKTWEAFGCFRELAAWVAGTAVDAFDDLFSAENFAVSISGAGIDANVTGCCA